MSNYNLTKTVLGTALAVALVAGTASAATVTFGATKGNHAFEVTNLTTGTDATKQPLATRTGSVVYTLKAGDAAIGKTTTDNLLVKATFTGAKCGPAPTVTSAKATISSVTCTAGGNVLQFKAVPLAALAADDVLFTVTADTLAFADATGLTSVDGKVDAAIEIREFDGSQNIIQAASTFTILTAKQASKITIADATNATTTPASNGKQFPAAATGGSIDADTVQLAKITTLANQTDPTSSALGAGAVFTDNGSAGDFKFDVVGTVSTSQSSRDRLQVEVSFTDATGFTQVSLEKATTCPASKSTAAAGSVVVLTQATNLFSGSLDMADGDSAGSTYVICGTVNTTDALQNQAVTTRARFDLLTGRDTDFAAAKTTSNLSFDGTALDVLYINPAANTAQVSFLRVSNTSTVSSGLVTINKVCDDGAAGVQSTVTLNAKTSKVFTATELENGGNGLTPGLGVCAGTAVKSRLTVKGAFPGMKVQSFLRNVNSSGTTTTNINLEN